MFSRRPGGRFNRGRWAFGVPTVGGGPPADTDPPGITSIVINSDGVSGRITFNEAMNTASPPTASSLTLNNTLATVLSSSWLSSTQLDFTLTGYRVIGSAFATVTMSYTAGATVLEDAAGNDLANFSGASLTNNSIHAPMAHTETLFSGTSWTSPADLYGTSIFLEGWAAGEGGQTATKAGDSGYYCNKTDTIDANTAYSYAIGAAGTTGGGNGGDITWRTSIMVCPGGGSATSPVGDVTRAGGTGQSGAGAATGGGSSGSSTAASGGTSGEPNGAPGVNGNNTSRIPGTGGASTGSAQRAGGAGYLRLTCSRHPPLTGPYITAVAEYRDGAALTTRDLATPGTHQSGDIAVAECATTGATAATSAQATATFTTSNGTDVHLVTLVRTCTGSDTFTIASAASNGAYRIWRIRGSTGAANVEVTGATGSGTAPNSGAHTPSGGSVERLVFAQAACQALSSNNNSVTAFPANYNGLYTPQRSNASNSAGLVGGTRREAASSYTPGAFSGSVASWACVTGSVE